LAKRLFKSRDDGEGIFPLKNAEKIKAKQKNKFIWWQKC